MGDEVTTDELIAAEQAISILWEKGMTSFEIREKLEEWLETCRTIDEESGEL